MPTNNKPPPGGFPPGEPPVAVASGETAGGPSDDVIVVYATFPGREAALACGRGLVEAGLAGCANVLPAMTSVYIWDGKLETSQEAVLIAKAVRGVADAVVTFIVGAHSYDVPAIVILPAIGGHGPYLEWIRAACQAKCERPGPSDGQ